MIKSRRMRWAGHVARMGETRNAYRILVGKPERKRPQGRPVHLIVSTGRYSGYLHTTRNFILHTDFYTDALKKVLTIKLCCFKIWRLSEE
jgi:hypothetical protein